MQGNIIITIKYVLLCYHYSINDAENSEHEKLVFKWLHLMR